LSTRQVASQGGRPAPRLHPSPTAPELAAAILAGLERRGTGALEHAVRGLQSEADLLSVAPVARPTPWRAFVVLLRRFTHALMRPWLAVQSEFNQSVLHTLERLTHEVGALAAAITAVEEREGAEAIGDRTSEPGAARPPPSRGLLETVFAHSRLPAPPGRVLLLAKDGDGLGAILQAFGFELVDPEGAVPEASIDAAVALSLAEQAPVDRIASLLRPGGRLIAAIPLGAVTRTPGRPSPKPAVAVEALLEPLRCIELVFCIQEDDAWRLVPDATALSDACAEASALVVAERP
jgi:hypothetical protein